MKALCITLALSLLLLAGPLGTNADAAVILNDASIELVFGSTALTLTQSIPPGQGLFAIEIVDQGFGFFQFHFAGIAQEYALFDAVPGLEFTPAYASQNTPLVSNNPVHPGSALLNFAPGESKYFAYWDDRGPFGGGPVSDDNYGWVRLTRDPLGLVASESVTALGGGIIVGTDIQIPEPGRVVLLLCGFAFV